MYTSILVPVDGSDYAQKALKVACQLVKPSPTTLYLLHIAERPVTNATIGIGVGVAPLPYTVEEAQEAGSKVLGRALQVAGLSDGEVTTMILQGSPARTIIDEAKRLGVDAIVMGSRGMSDLKGLAIGSVSHKVSHIAPCTVITVH